MNDDFEHQLARFRPDAAPERLAETIFSAARPHLLPAHRRTKTDAWLIWIWKQFQNTSPAARALAAIWFVCLGINYLVGSGLEGFSPDGTRPTPEQIAEMRAQRAQLIELAGLPAPRPIRAPQPSAPGPRSELSFPLPNHKG